MSQNNITENLFGAIDVIIAQKIKGLQFDLTKICTITDNSKAQNGAYAVTDGSITFEAYSENKNYKVGDAVRVSVPNADFTDKKYIIGKYITDNSITPITYVSPLESILDITTNLVPEEKRGPHHLYANEQVAESTTVEDLVKNSKGALIATIRPNIESLEVSEIYDTFYIAGEFRTLLGDYTILTGNYGIRAEFHDGDQVHEIYLDSQDMFGDPYNFAVFTSQQQTYNIEKIKKIDEISLYFYQFNNFSYDKNGEPTVLPCYKTLPANLELTNLTIGFGTMLSNMDDNTVKIYTNSSKEYKQNSPSSCEKKINLLWYNKNEFGKYLGFSDGSFIKDDNSIYDEFDDYITDQAHERALMKYLGDDQVPHDTRGLQFAVDLNNLNKMADDIIKYVNETILPAIDTFGIQANIKDSAADLHQNIKNYIDGNETENIRGIRQIQEEANKYIKDTLAAAAYQYNPTTKSEDEQVSENVPEYPNYKENAVLNYGTQISAIRKYIIEEILGKISDTIKLNDSYTGIYDNFENKNNTFIKHLNTLNNADNLNFANINLYREDNYDSIADNDYQGFELHTEQDFSDFANKYSIYWYRYDPNNLLDDTYISGDSFVSANWKRDTNKTYNDEKTATSYTFTANADKNTEEHVMAVVFYNHEYYKSNVITFTNSDKILDDRTENLTAGIVLSHGKNSREAYQLYGATNSLLNQAEANYDREIVVQFMENDTTVNDDKLKNCQIYWYFPNNSTMLDSSVLNKQETTFDNASESSKYALEGYTCYYQPAAAEVNRSFYYRIKDYYVQSLTQNHIKCKVVTPDGYEYDATVYFCFTSFGTSGTDYTLHITPIGEQSAVLPDKPLELKISLYNYNNEQVTYTFSNDNVTLDTDNYTIESIENNIVKISKSDTDNYYGILSVSAEVGLSNGMLVNLKSYYPLAYSTKNYFIEGTTTIIYNDAGSSPVYYKDPYKLYDWETKNEEKNVMPIDIDDENFTPNSEQTEKDNPNYDILPKITNNILRPCVMYVTSDIAMQPVVIIQLKNDEKDKYYQSIYISQNRYQMSMLNSWDNSLTIDEKNGTILSQIVGAGRKNGYHQFSGVLMGEVNINPDPGEKDEYEAKLTNHSGYGLYGFHQGAQSFGFNVDGTAFLGKSGRGRIFFDGNSGTIESASYQSLNGSAGMKIDLDDGFIHMRGAAKNNDNIYKSTQSDIYLGVMPQKNDSAYFSIGSENGNRLIHIGIDDYYLQTDNFVSNNKINYVNIYDENGNALLDDYGNAITIQASSNYSNVYDEDGNVLMDDEGNLIITQPVGAGTKIDLKNGKIISYDFTIDARSGNNHLLLSSSAELYPLTINDVFKVDWTGAMFSTSGIIGSNPATGQLFISGNQIVAGGAKDNHSDNVKSIVYLQKGTSVNLNLGSIGYGTVNNDFYLGAGGLIFKNTSNETDYGMRLTSAGLIVDGANEAWEPDESNLGTTFDSSAKFSTFYQGYGITFAFKSKDSSILFNNTSIENANFIGFTEDGGLQLLSPKQDILIDANNITLSTSNGKIRLANNNDLYQGNNDQGIFEKIQLLEKQIEDLTTIINNNSSNNSGSTLPSTPGNGEVTPEIKD